jgi:hypothetical protein
MLKKYRIDYVAFERYIEFNYSLANCLVVFLVGRVFGPSENGYGW